MGRLTKRGRALSFVFDRWLDGSQFLCGQQTVRDIYSWVSFYDSVTLRDNYSWVSFYDGVRLRDNYSLVSFYDGVTLRDNYSWVSFYDGVTLRGQLQLGLVL